MKGFYSVIDAIVKGYTVRPAEMKFTPTGKPVTTCVVGCGGSKTRAGTFIEVIAWNSAAEKLNELANAKGLAVRAVGVVSQRKWKYNDKFYEKLELIYLSELAVQSGGDLVEVEIEAKGDGSKSQRESNEAVKEAVKAK